MWIIPKTLSAFVPDTEGLNLELDEQAWMLERSVTASGKVMSKQYWLRQLKKGGWIPHLYGLMLRPSLHRRFEEKYTDSLVDAVSFATFDSAVKSLNAVREKLTTECWVDVNYLEFPRPKPAPILAQVHNTY